MRKNKFEINKFFSDKNVLYHDKFGDYLISNHHIISLNKRIYIYKDGIYQEDDFLLKSIMTALIPSIKEFQRNEVMNYIKYRAPERELANERFIATKNGVIDIKEDRLLEHNPNLVLINKINASYKRGVYDENVIRFFKTITEEEDTYLLLEEIIGYTLLRKNIFNKTFLLVGPGGNGKSAYLNLISAFLGLDNISSLSLSELNSKFRTAMLENKLANIGDDISNENIKDTSVLKKLSTGERLVVEQKGQDPFSFRNYSKLIFSANSYPSFNDSSDGLYDRLLIIPFTKRIRGTKLEDPYLEEKLNTEEARSTVLNIALRGLKRLLQNQSFTIPEKSDSLLREFKINNDPIKVWLEDLSKSGEDIIMKSVDEIFNNFNDWCEVNYYKGLIKKKGLSMKLKDYGYKTKTTRINGEVTRVYMPI